MHYNTMQCNPAGTGTVAAAAAAAKCRRTRTGIGTIPRTHTRRIPTTVTTTTTRAVHEQFLQLYDVLGPHAFSRPHCCPDRVFDHQVGQVGQGSQVGQGFQVGQGSQVLQEIQGHHNPGAHADSHDGGSLFEPIPQRRALPRHRQ